ncbi:hypothetical protein [Variovorax sp. dw_954]|uniref:hypothetical protein n=1 Tax=Variovorax sp. dw_954 TaxID=2720078 RepID=UPI001BD3B57E|nr:hypothetical protein [Variovorax sp. dw_954]
MHINWREAVLTPSKWQDRASRLFLLALVIGGLWYALQPTPAEKAAKERADKEAQMGSQATVVGSMIAAGGKACLSIGIQTIDACMTSDGILTQEVTARELAKVAVKDRDDFLAWCPGPRTREQCADLLNRSIRLAWYAKD